MKVPAAVQRELLTVADLDQRIARVKHRHKNLPEHKQLRELGRTRAAIGDEIVDAQTRLGDAKLEAERIEADLEPARARLVRNEQAIEAGHLDAKALRAMVEESDHLRGRIDKLEDAELEAMQLIEDLEKEYQGTLSRQAEIDGQIAALTTSRDEQTAEMMTEGKQLTEARQTTASKLPAELMALYQKAAARQGTGAAELRNSRCTGCTLELNSTELKRIAAAPADEVVRCEECGRVLVR